MTTENPHQCPTCGAAMARPQEEQPPAPPPKRYLIEYHAPAGVVREVAGDGAGPAEILKAARDVTLASGLNESDFEPYDDAFCVRQIIVMDEDNVEQAVWTDLDYLHHLHAGEILDQLEAMIEAADELSEARDALDSRVSEVIDCGEHAGRALAAIRREGGAQ